VDSELVTRCSAWADLECSLVTLGDLHANCEGKHLHRIKRAKKNKKMAITMTVPSPKNFKKMSKSRKKCTQNKERSEDISAYCMLIQKWGRLHLNEGVMLW